MKAPTGILRLYVSTGLTNASMTFSRMSIRERFRQLADIGKELATDRVVLPTRHVRAPIVHVVLARVLRLPRRRTGKGRKSLPGVVSRSSSQQNR